MKIVGLKEENREYFSGLDPFNIMGRECKNGAVCLGAVMREKNEETPAGLIVFTLNENELLINWIYVEPRYRGLEIGAAFHGPPFTLELFSFKYNTADHTIKWGFHKE